MVNKSYQKERKKSSKIEERFDLDNATLYGGASTILDYINGTGLKKEFQKAVSIDKRGDSIYKMEDQLTVMVAGRLIGLERLYHFSTIEEDPLISMKLQLEKLPDYTILYKDLSRFETEEKVKSLEGVLWSYAWRCLKEQKHVILDIDSTVETVYGEQEGVEVGYNPHKPGRGSLHPIVAFDGMSRVCLGGRLRRGKSYAADGMCELYKEIKARLGSGCPIRYVRADRGFCGEDRLRFLESEPVGYVVKVKATHRLVKAAGGRGFRRLYETGEELIEATSVKYRATSWKKARRVVVIRKRPIEVEQGVLWEELLWEYEAIVTNLDWDEEDIYRFYNQRANCENMVKECKSGFGIDRISCDDFYPNYADLLIKLIAYNIFCAFKKEIFPKEKRWLTIGSVRRMFFLIPAILVRHARRLSRKHPWKREWLQIRKNLMLIGYT